VNAVVVFSIAGTLGALTLPGGQVEKARLEPHGQVAALLRELRAEGVSIGVAIPDARFDRASVEALLGSADFLPLVDPKLILGAPFSALQLEGPAVFVSRERTQRAQAAAGFRRVPHPSLVRAALRGETLHYVRARARQRLVRKPTKGQRFSWPPLLQGIELAPLSAGMEDGHPVLYAVAGEAALQKLAERVEVKRLGAPNLPESTDLVLFQTSFSGSAGAEFRRRLEALPLFLETPAGALVALDASQPVGEFHPPDDAHGHTRALYASSSLTSAGGDAPTPGGGELDDATREKLAVLDGGLLKQQLDPWIGSGAKDGDCGVPISSRFLYHPHNALAVAALVDALKNILGNAATHEFSLNGPRQNVWADLPGDAAGGHADEFVILGAHLDATSTRDGSCSLPVDVGCCAPGADDDASGIAAVLSIAAVLKQLADAVGAPRRTIRFALFNAEEQGMVGSEAYAADYADQHDIRAMFQLDMIGTPGLAEPASVSCADDAATPVPQRFEIHTGGYDDLGNTIYYGVNAAQEEMAQALETSATLLSPGFSVQRFPVAGCDRDPGSLKSDHTPFQLQGVPACYVCEELWTHDCPGSMRPHPTYHRGTDTDIDEDYAAAIARAVAGAVWLVANP
jgi:hypothetical protein